MLLKILIVIRSISKDPPVLCQPDWASLQVSSKNVAANNENASTEALPFSDPPNHEWAAPIRVE